MIPIGSMYGIFTYIYHKNQPNVGKYTINGSSGIGSFVGAFFQGRFGFRSVSWVASAAVDRESFSGFTHHEVQKSPPPRGWE